MQSTLFRLFFSLLAISAILDQNISAGPASVTVCDEASLRVAIQNGGTINFGCDATIVLTNTLQIVSSTVLSASGHNVVLSGGGSVRVLFVATNIDLTINNLTIANGKVLGTNGVDRVLEPDTDGESVFGGGLFNDGGRVVLNGCILSNNVAIARNGGASDGRNASGGAIYSNGGSLTIIDSLLAQNLCLGGKGSDGYFSLLASRAYGGAIYCNNTAVIITSSEVRNNSATGGVGPFYGSSYFPGPGFGGACFIEGADITITQTIFLNNQANGGTIPGDGPFGSSNTGSAHGGAAYFSNSIATISLCKFLTNNTASSYGGHRSRSSSAQGGAIFTTGALNVTDSLLAGNRCLGGDGDFGEAGGGAIFNRGSLTINRTTVAGNGARSGGSAGPARGGGVFNTGDFSGTNNTIVLNRAESGTGTSVNAEGGGVFNMGRMTLVHSTVALNAVQPGISYPPFPTWGSGLGTETYSTNGPALVQNTIIGSSLSGSNSFGVLIDGGNNISSDATCEFTAPGSLNNTDPLLSGLGEFGGPTPTMALLPGSPAIDHGLSINCPATDQRGIARPFGAACDIGAFEFTSQLPTGLSIAGYTNLVLHLTFTGTNGQTFQVKTSTDLVAWTRLSTNLIGANGHTDLSFTNDMAGSVRFFEAH